ncbi:MAG: hypothetical protein N2260_01785 [Syntrophobacterales bacterium]|nr:hypothetical protein [Syntrophobacterales bacterium]
MEINKKEKALSEYITPFSFPAIAFSGGRDSGFLAWFVRNKMKKGALILSADHELTPPGESEYRLRIAKTYGWLDMENVFVSLLDLPEINFNTQDRCYACKRRLMSVLIDVARSRGCDVLFDGTTLDELKKYRPGLRALDELGVKSPLIKTGWTKEEIRKASRTYELLFAEKPSESCLATRFPYNQELTPHLIETVSEFERKIRSTVDGSFRARVHPEIRLIRIEVDLTCIKDIFLPEIREELVKIAKASGFKWVTVDIEGFRSGSWDLSKD